MHPEPFLSPVGSGLRGAGTDSRLGASAYTCTTRTTTDTPSGTRPGAPGGLACEGLQRGARPRGRARGCDLLVCRCWSPQPPEHAGEGESTGEEATLWKAFSATGWRWFPQRPRGSFNPVNDPLTPIPATALCSCTCARHPHPQRPLFSPPLHPSLSESGKRPGNASGAPQAGLQLHTCQRPPFGVSGNLMHAKKSANCVATKRTMNDTSSQG